MHTIESGLHGAHLFHDLAGTLGRHGLRSELDGGHYVRFSKQVVVERERSADLLTRSAAALLLAGREAVLTSHTSVLLYGCAAADHAPVHVLLPYRRPVRSRPGVAIHHSAIEAWHVEILHGMPVLALEHALAEMLCRAKSSTAFACLDQALAMLPAEHRDEMRARVAKSVLNRADPRGYRRATVLLEHATGMPESPAESWVMLTLVDGGLPPPVPQFAIVGADGRERYRLDFAWPDLRVALEYDGYAAHEGRAAQDQAREEDLARRGWIIVRATAEDLRSPGRLVESVRAAFRRRKVAV
jgi:hypothetical protein